MCEYLADETEQGRANAAQRSYPVAASSEAGEADRSATPVNKDVIRFARNAIRGTRLQHGVGNRGQVALDEVGQDTMPRDAAVVVRLGRCTLVTDLAR
jgi:hypothetical protein